MKSPKLEREIKKKTSTADKLILCTKIQHRKYQAQKTYMELRHSNRNVHLTLYIST